METNSVQHIHDTLAIQEIRARFAEGQDYRQWAQVEDLLTEQVTADFRSMGIPIQTVPREVLVKNFQNNLSREGLKTQHLYTNLRVKVDGYSAVCISQFTGQHYFPGAAGGDEFILRGEYEDKLVRRPDGWKISEMKFTLFYATGNPQLLNE